MEPQQEEPAVSEQRGFACGRGVTGAGWGGRSQALAAVAAAVEGQLGELLAAVAAPSSGLHAFDFLGACLLPEVDEAVAASLPGACRLPPPPPSPSPALRRITDGHVPPASFTVQKVRTAIFEPGWPCRVDLVIMLLILMRTQNPPGIAGIAVTHPGIMLPNGMSRVRTALPTGRGNHPRRSDCGNRT